MVTAVTMPWADGGVRAAERQMTGSDSAAWRIAAFQVETDDVNAHRGEMHPEAGEAVCRPAGGVRLHFRATRPGGAEEMVRVPVTSATFCRFTMFVSLMTSFLLPHPAGRPSPIRRAATPPGCRPAAGRLRRRGGNT
ncbi:hypothetical protein [Streptomyces sp. NPDC088766]|uniref:hypothetical protein n=1 Tax=Streptomyces sp. NPDC088766 TaxID=3365893 RepID=UPI003825B0EF